MKQYTKLQPNSHNWEDFGNYNYGLTGAATGLFLLETLLREAGKAQCIAGTSKPAWGTPASGNPFGDDPNDQYWILQGWLDYQSGLYGNPNSSVPLVPWFGEKYSQSSAPDTCNNSCEIWGNIGY